MTIKGKVLSVNISEKKGVIKKPITIGRFKEDHGLVGDAHAGKWHRQVSLLGVESVNKMRAQGVKGLTHGIFAENITIEGVILYEIPVGTRIRIGETIQEITQIGKECHNGCEIKAQVGHCVMPTEGVFTRVIKGGEIRADDVIELA